MRPIFCAGVLLAALACGEAAAADAKPSFTQDDARAIIGNLQKVVTPNGIDRRMAIPINGTQQWITVRGRDLRNPILLFIHGGPAAPEMPTSWTFQNPWEDYFTVVQWDQRGAGKTYNANDPAKVAPTMNLVQMEADTEAVVQYLRATYAREKIFVLGHSWGSILGLTLAHNHPEWLYAYIGMGQMIDTRRAERLDYLATLQAAEDAHNDRAVKELRALEPYPEADGAIPLSKLNPERDWSVKLWWPELAPRQLRLLLSCCETVAGLYRRRSGRDRQGFGVVAEHARPGLRVVRLFESDGFPLPDRAVRRPPRFHGVVRRSSGVVREACTRRSRSWCGSRIPRT